MGKMTLEETMKEICFNWFKAGFDVGIQNPGGCSLESEFEELWKKRGT